MGPFPLSRRRPRPHYDTVCIPVSHFVSVSVHYNVQMQESTEVDTPAYHRVALFYRYVRLENVAEVVEWLRLLCTELGLLGRVLVSKEGINGTLAGTVTAVEAFVQHLSADLRFNTIDWKFTDEAGSQLPFLGLSIREVDEIISSGRARNFIEQHIDYSQDSYGGIVGTGTHLSPQEFHAAIGRKDGVILDVRNEFEHDIGHFEGATNLKTYNYAETFDVLDELLPTPTTSASSEGASQPEDREVPSEQPNIYMYCTGGIRCEKASAYLCAKGFKNVYQLEGGIHRYLEAFPDGGLFRGKNFVFDSRVAVGPSAASSVDGRTAPKEPFDEGKEVNETCSAVEGTGTAASAGAVVGRCIDCAAPHEVYSGRVVCTVCRMPVLVCPQCVASNPVPGEYHCSRHRDLKELYFSVLTRFTAEQLRAQAQGLRALEEQSAAHLAKQRDAERIARRVAASAKHRSNQYTTAAIAVTVEDGQLHGTEESAVNHSKQRRRTLRKQIERIEALLKHMDSECGDAVAVEDILQQHSNPKTRGGWGFWKT